MGERERERAGVWRESISKSEALINKALKMKDWKIDEDWKGTPGNPRCAPPAQHQPADRQTDPRTRQTPDILTQKMEGTNNGAKGG